MSEELKTMLCFLLDILELKAKQTKNPIDDVVVKGFKALLNCQDKPKTKPSLN